MTFHESNITTCIELPYFLFFTFSKNNNKETSTAKQKTTNSVQKITMLVHQFPRRLSKLDEGNNIALPQRHS